MRIPIFLVDLRTKRGFHRITKKLQNNWPGSPPITQYNAHQILSKAFGYSDFHALQKSAESASCLHEIPAPSVVRDNLSTSIYWFCRSQVTVSFDEEDIDQLVNLLPLQELLVFQNPNRTQAQNTSVTAGDPSQPFVNLGAIAREIITGSACQPAGIPEFGYHRGRGSPLNVTELTRILETALRDGNLRDQCLVLGLLHGLRPNELRTCRVRDSSLTLERVKLESLSVKSRVPVVEKTTLHHYYASLLATYIKNDNLFPGDLLFPSLRDSSSAMSSYKMTLSLAPYFQDAIPDRSLIAPSLISHSVRMQAKKRDA